MKITIIGAGAIGGYVGVKLALAGEQVSFIVRGRNLQAIRDHGMTLVLPTARGRWRATCTPPMTTPHPARRTWSSSP